MRLGTVEYKYKAVEITALWQSLAAFSSKFPIAQVLVGSGVESNLAQKRGEDAIIAIQGALYRFAWIEGLCAISASDSTIAATALPGYLRQNFGL